MYQTLLKYQERGLVRMQKHPEHDLWIANYTPECQYNRHWDPVTLMARGLVVDQSGVVARGPIKFFNWEELIDMEIPLETCIERDALRENPVGGGK